MTTCRSKMRIMIKGAVLALLFSVWLLPAAPSQSIVGFGTRWSDSFAEWVIYTEIEGEEGELRQKWQMQDDWTDWQYRLGNASGNIRLKWKDNPNEWEARGDGQIATARTVWNNNFREWRITDGRHSCTLVSRDGNVWDEWMLRASSAGDFQMYTVWQGDPREWDIVDELAPEISLPARLLAAFIVAFHSSPRQ
jgi:hypothetical protein